MAWTVADVMTREVVTVGPETPFKVCADLMRIHEVSALPVVASGRVLGIVSEADLMRTVAGGGRRVAVAAKDVMSRDVVSVTQGATVAAAARLMFDRNVKRLPVVDSTRRLIGIVSRSDVLRVFLRSDESIRKEGAHILDELPLLGRGRVEVDVRDGVVRLRGEVPNENLATLLIRLIGGVPGVVGVENRLHEPAPETPLSEPRAASSGLRARA
ncbi:MAG TPA: CBS domain-containing protein [Candidatus Dormibacteraeota bacterium]|nr:CBS domain-containing protein [Candidatus Dormibacteraeota bacterium]